MCLTGVVWGTAQCVDARKTRTPSTNRRRDPPGAGRRQRRPRRTRRLNGCGGDVALRFLRTATPVLTVSSLRHFEVRRRGLGRLSTMCVSTSPPSNDAHRTGAVARVPFWKSKICSDASSGFFFGEFCSAAAHTSRAGAQAKAKAPKSRRTPSGNIEGSLSASSGRSHRAKAKAPTAVAHRCSKSRSQSAYMHREGFNSS